MNMNNLIPMNFGHTQIEICFAFMPQTFKTIVKFQYETDLAICTPPNIPFHKQNTCMIMSL